MQEDVILNKLSKIIQTVYMTDNAKNLKLEYNLRDDLGLDSLDAVELTMYVEDEFELNIPSHVSDNIETVQQLYDYIKKHS
jgi:acyl carrier protein